MSAERVSQPPAAVMARTPLQLLVVLAFAAFAVTIGGGMLLHGWSFYSLGLDARVDHPAFRALSPGGQIGRAYGEVGAALVLLNLLYLVRRRLARLPLGSMKVWLDAHVLTGSLAGTFVIFHSAFQLRTPIATMTAASMAFTIVTGIIGRFLYAFAPKSSVGAFSRTVRAIDGVMPGLGAWIAKQVEAVPPTRLGVNATLFRTLATLPAWRAQAKARREAIEMAVLAWAALQEKPKAEQRHVQDLCRRAAKLAWRDVRSAAAAAMLESWRALHRFAALLMVLSVIVHIVVAVYYGYGSGGE